MARLGPHSSSLSFGNNHQPTHQPVGGRAAPEQRCQPSEPLEAAEFRGSGVSALLRANCVTLGKSHLWNLNLLGVAREVVAAGL